MNVCLIESPSACVDGVLVEFDPTSTHDPVDLAWAGGFIDGEGSFTVTVKRGRRGRRYPLVSAVQVENDAPILRLRNLFGGTVIRTRTYHDRQSFIWHLSGAARLRAFLPQIISYLYVKQWEAVVLLKLCRMIELPAAKGQPRPVVTDADIRERERLAALLRDVRVSSIRRVA